MRRCNEVLLLQQRCGRVRFRFEHIECGTGNLAGGMMTVQAQVLLSELDGYANKLKSITAGSGSYSMELSHYDPVPPPLQAQLANDYKARHKQPEEE